MIAYGHPLRIISAASTNANVIKKAYGTLLGMAIFNSAGAARYLKLYDKATNPNPAVDVPIATYTIPANGSLIIPNSMCGIKFETGIACLITTVASDTDATATGANEVIANFLYL